MSEEAKGKEESKVVAGVPVHNEAKLKPKWRIIKRPSPDEEPEEILEFEDNVFLNEGINHLWTVLCGGGGTLFTHQNAAIGVGNGTVAASATQTGLQGAQTAYGTMNQNYPTYGSNQEAVFRSTFGTAEANFDWNEITVNNRNATFGAGGSTINVNRLVQSMGTKAAGTSWTAELTVSIS